MSGLDSAEADFSTEISVGGTFRFSNQRALSQTLCTFLRPRSTRDRDDLSFAAPTMVYL